MKINPNLTNCQITHGTVMGLAFAFLFPVGAIIIRTASFRGAVYIHAATQAFAYALAIVGFGLGIYIAVYPESQVRRELVLATKYMQLTEGSDQSRQRSPDHWHCGHWLSPISTNLRRDPPLHLQKAWQAELLDTLACLVGKSHYHSWYDQWWLGTPAQWRHYQRRDCVRSHCWVHVASVGQRYCLELLQKQRHRKGSWREIQPT